MKLIKQIHCAECGVRIFTNGVKCKNAQLNGCDNHFCFMCWPDHVKVHDAEWDKLTEHERERIIREFRG